MKKAGIVTAAAAMLATSAMAGTVTITFDGRCDSIIVYHSEESVFYGGTYNACNTTTLVSGWGGLKAETRGIGENVALHFYDASVEVPIPYVFDIQLPLKTGHRWVLYESPDGVVVNELASGTYTVASAGQTTH
jgi:hypothetical protein